MLITLDYLVLNLLTNVQSKPNSHRRLLRTNLGLMQKKKNANRRNLGERERGVENVYNPAVLENNCAISVTVQLQDICLFQPQQQR